MNDKMQGGKKRKEKKEIIVQIKKTGIPVQKTPFLNQHMPWSGVVPLSN